MVQFLDVAAQIGLDGVELTAYYFPSTERAYLHGLKKEAHLRGLSVSGSAISTNFAQADPDLRRNSVELTRTWLAHSVELGAPTLRVFAGAAEPGVIEEDPFGWAVSALQECTRHAEQEGVMLALENHHGLTRTAEQTLRLIDAVGSPWLGLNLDFGNFQGHIYEAFAVCAPRAIAGHAKRHFKGESGAEVVDYGRVRSILDTAGYRGWLAIEYEDPGDPHVEVPEFARELRSQFR